MAEDREDASPGDDDAEQFEVLDEVGEVEWDGDFPENSEDIEDQAVEVVEIEDDDDDDAVDIVPHCGKNTGNDGSLSTKSNSSAVSSNKGTAENSGGKSTDVSPKAEACGKSTISNSQPDTKDEKLSETSTSKDTESLKKSPESSASKVEKPSESIAIKNENVSQECSIVRNEKPSKVEEPSPVKNENLSKETSTIKNEKLESSTIRDGKKSLTESTTSKTEKTSRDSSTNKSEKSLKDSSSIEKGKSSKDLLTSQDEKSSKDSSTSKNEKSSKDSLSSKNEKSLKDSLSSKDEKSSKDSLSSKNEKSLKDSSSSKDEKSSKESLSSKNEKSSKDSSSSKNEKSSKDSSSSKNEKSSKDSSSSKNEKSSKDSSSSKNEKPSNQSSPKKEVKRSEKVVASNDYDKRKTSVTSESKKTEVKDSESRTQGKTSTAPKRKNDDPGVKGSGEKKMKHSVETSDHKKMCDDSAEEYSFSSDPQRELLNKKKTFVNSVIFLSEELKNIRDFRRWSEKKRKDGMLFPVFDLNQQREPLKFSKCQLFSGREVGSTKLCLGIRKSSSDVLKFSADKRYVPVIGKVVKAFEEMVQSCDKPLFDPISQRGYWHGISVLANSKGRAVLQVQLFATNEREGEVRFADAKDILLRAFNQKNTAGDHGVSSIYIRLVVDKKQDSQETNLPESVANRCIMGSGFIIEVIKGMKVKLFPWSFFSTGTHAMTNLCEEIITIQKREHCETIVELGCGTGIIGQVMSPVCTTILGLDFPETIAEAENNAKQNRLKNCMYLNGKLKEALSKVSDILRNSTSVMVVVNSLNYNAGYITEVAWLRRMSKVTRVVYITSLKHPKFSRYVDLCTPGKEVRQHHNDSMPYLPLYALPVNIGTKTLTSIIVFKHVENNFVNELYQSRENYALPCIRFAKSKNSRPYMVPEIETKPTNSSIKNSSANSKNVVTSKSNEQNSVLKTSVRTKNNNLRAQSSDRVVSAGSRFRKRSLDINRDEDRRKNMVNTRNGHHSRGDCGKPRETEPSSSGSGNVWVNKDGLLTKRVDARQSNEALPVRDLRNVLHNRPGHNHAHNLLGPDRLSSHEEVTDLRTVLQEKRMYVERAPEFSDDFRESKYMHDAGSDLRKRKRADLNYEEDIVPPGTEDLRQVLLDKKVMVAEDIAYNERNTHRRDLHDRSTVDGRSLRALENNDLQSFSEENRVTHKSEEKSNFRDPARFSYGTETWGGGHSDVGIRNVYAPSNRTYPSGVWGELHSRDSKQEAFPLVKDSALFDASRNSEKRKVVLATDFKFSKHTVRGSSQGRSFDDSELGRKARPRSDDLASGLKTDVRSINIRSSSGKDKNTYTMESFHDSFNKFDAHVRRANSKSLKENHQQGWKTKSNLDRSFLDVGDQRACSPRPKRHLASDIRKENLYHGSDKHNRYSGTDTGKAERFDFSDRNRPVLGDGERNRTVFEDERNRMMHDESSRNRAGMHRSERNRTIDGSERNMTVGVSVNERNFGGMDRTGPFVAGPDENNKMFCRREDRSRPVLGEATDRRKVVFGEMADKQRQVIGETKDRHRVVFGETDRHKPILNEPENRHRLVIGENEDRHRPVYGETEERRTYGETEDRRTYGGPEDRRTYGETEVRRTYSKTEDRRTYGEAEDRHRSFFDDSVNRHRPVFGETEDKNKPVFSGTDERHRSAFGETGDRLKSVYGETEDRCRPAYSKAEDKNRSVYGETNARHKPVFGENVDKHRPAFGETEDKHKPVFAGIDERHRVTFGVTSDMHKSMYNETENRHKPHHETDVRHNPVFGETGDSHRSSFGKTGENQRPLFSNTGDSYRPVFGEIGDVLRPVFGETGDSHRPLYGETGNNHRPVYGKTEDKDRSMYGETKDKHSSVYGGIEDKRRSVYGKTEEKDRSVYGKTEDRDRSLYGGTENRNRPAYVGPEVENKTTYDVSEERNRLIYGGSNDSNRQLYGGPEDKNIFMFDGSDNRKRALFGGSDDRKLPNTGGTLRIGSGIEGTDRTGVAVSEVDRDRTLFGGHTNVSRTSYHVKDNKVKMSGYNRSYEEGNHSAFDNNPTRSGVLNLKNSVDHKSLRVKENMPLATNILQHDYTRLPPATGEENTKDKAKQSHSVQHRTFIASKKHAHTAKKRQRNHRRAQTQQTKAKQATGNVFEIPVLQQGQQIKNYTKSPVCDNKTSSKQYTDEHVHASDRSAQKGSLYYWTNDRGLAGNTSQMPSNANKDWGSVDQSASTSWFNTRSQEGRQGDAQGWQGNMEKSYERNLVGLPPSIDAKQFPALLDKNFLKYGQSNERQEASTGSTASASFGVTLGGYGHTYLQGHLSGSATAALGVPPNTGLNNMQSYSSLTGGDLSSWNARSANSSYNWANM